MRPPHAAVVALLVLACALLPSRAPAQAAGGTRPISVVVSGGATVPTGSFKDYHDLGLHADVSLLLNLLGRSLRLRPELTYGRFALSDDIRSALQLARQGASGSATSAAYGSDAVSTLLGGFGNIEVPLAGGLYVLAGVGAVGLSTDATTGGQSINTTNLSYNGGAGVRFKIGSIAGFLEGRLTGISVDKGKALFKDVRTVPVTFGFVF